MSHPTHEGYWMRASTFGGKVQGHAEWVYLIAGVPYIDEHEPNGVRHRVGAARYVWIGPLVVDTGESADLREALAKAELERDAARREVCEIVAGACRCLPFVPQGPEPVARHRGWDCYTADAGDPVHDDAAERYPQWCVDFGEGWDTERYLGPFDSPAEATRAADLELDDTAIRRCRSFELSFVVEGPLVGVICEGDDP